MTEIRMSNLCWVFASFTCNSARACSRVTVRATVERLSQDLAGDPKHIYKHKIRQESAPSRGS